MLVNVLFFLFLCFVCFVLFLVKFKFYLDLLYFFYLDVKIFLEEMDIDWLMEFVGCEVVDVIYLDLFNNFFICMFLCILLVFELIKSKRIFLLVCVFIFKCLGYVCDF